MEMGLLERAIFIAVQAHAGQRDKSDYPYILHPLRLMMQMETVEEMVVAVLHDVVEDSSVTLKALAAEGMPASVLESIALLTHNNETESYQTYLERLKPNPLARKVKLADLRHNMEFTRLTDLRPKDLERLQKYHRAWQFLTSE